ncbi:MAG: hypothetical protein ABEK42_10420, partial [Thiohalorhabdaceae bacterium]
YSADQAERAVSAVGEADLSVEELLKRSLQQMTR